jgi:hypothetical protein
MIRSARLLCLVLLLLAISPAVADDANPPGEDSAPGAQDQTLTAWEKLQTARAESKTLKDAFSGLFQKMKTEEGKAAARVVFREVYKQAGTMEWKAEQAFIPVFRDSDWSRWSGAEHADMLRDGLNLTAIEAVESDPVLAVRAWELLVKEFPDSNEAAYAKSTWLPIALPAMGDTGLALKRIGELLEQAGEVDKPGLRMAIGDVYAMQGEFEKAQAEYAGVVADIEAAGELEKYDRRASVKRYAELRVALIGKPAPEVDSKMWFGGESRKLSDLKGTVVVLDYWATW